MATTPAADVSAHPATDVDAQPSDGQTDWSGVADTLGINADEVTPEAVKDAYERRDRERDAGMNRRFDEVAAERRQLQTEREELALQRGRIEGERATRDSSGKADPAKFYEQLGVDDPDEPLTARQLYNQQAPVLNWMHQASDGFNDGIRRVDARIDEVSARGEMAVGFIGAELVARQIGEITEKYPHANMDELLDLAIGYDNPDVPVSEALDRAARSSQQGFLTKADEVQEQRAAEVADRRSKGHIISRGGGAVAGEDQIHGADGRVDWDKVADLTFPGNVDEPT